MKKMIIAISIIFCLISSAYAEIANQLESGSFEYKCEGDSTTLAGYTAANGATVTTDGDIATFDSVPYKYYIGDDWVAATSNTNGWTYEIRFKVGTDYPDDYHINLSLASVENDPDDKRQLIRFKGSEIYIYGVGLLVSEDLTSDFHTLRVAQDSNSSSYSFWVDDNFIFSHNGSLSATETKYTFGALSGSNHGLFYIDYIRFTGSGAYAPGTHEPVVKATSPTPTDGALEVGVDQVLSWTNGEIAASHDIYLGTDRDAVIAADRNSPLYKTNIPATSPSTYDPDLGYGATYYWRVDPVDDNGVAQCTGNVWGFTTTKNVYDVLGDLNGDHKVDIDDLNIFASQWLNGPGCPTPDCADFNGTGGVDYDDLSILTSNWLLDEPPTITLIGDATVSVTQNTSYVDQGATASDAIDGDITASIVVDNPVDTSVVGTYIVRYNVTDSGGNAAPEVTRTVSVIAPASDDEPPVITLTGANPQIIPVGNSYSELGATAIDYPDGDDISNDIVIDASNVNTSVAGNYYVTYNVSDAAGNAAAQVTRTVMVTNLDPVNVQDNYENVASSYDPWSSSAPIHKYATGLNSSQITFNHFGADSDTPDGSAKSFYIDADVNVDSSTRWYYYLALPLPAGTTNLQGRLATSFDIKLNDAARDITTISADIYGYPIMSKVIIGPVIPYADQWYHVNLRDLSRTFKVDAPYLFAGYQSNSSNYFYGNAYDLKIDDIGLKLSCLMIRLVGTGSQHIEIHVDNYKLTGTQMNPTQWYNTYIDSYRYPAWHAYHNRVQNDIDQISAQLAALTPLPTLPANASEKQTYQYNKLNFYKTQIANNISTMNSDNAYKTGSGSWVWHELMRNTRDYLARYKATIDDLIKSINSPAPDFELYKVPAMKFGYLDGYTFPMDYPELTSYNLRMAAGEYKSIAMLLDPAPGYNATLTFENTDFTDGSHTFAASNLDTYVAKIWYQAGRYNSIKEGGSKRFLTQELLLKNENLVRVTHHANESNGLPDGDNELWVTDSDGTNGRYINISTVYSTKDPTFPYPRDIHIADSETLQPFELSSAYKLLWSIIHIPESTPAGTYTSTLKIKQDGNVVRSIPLQIEVLPFDLAPSRLEYGLYYHGQMSSVPDSSVLPLSCHEKTHAQSRIELQDMYDHGVYYPAHYESNSNIIDDLLEIKNDIGFPKDKFYSVGLLLRSYTTKERVMKWQDVLSSYGYDPYGLHLYSMDEADGPTLASLIQTTIDEVYSVGAKTICSVYQNSFDYIGNYLDVAIYANGTHGPNVEEQINDWHSAGQKFFIYSDPQTGIENPEVYRRNYGIRAQLMGVDGVMDYAYQKEYGVMWNDFDTKTTEPARREETFTYPTHDGIVGTIEWEGFRAAINDTRYLSTLLDIHDQKEANGEDVSALDAWIANLDYEGDLDDLREQIIDKILYLSNN